jgi:hypothetical protein
MKGYLKQVGVWMGVLTGLAGLYLSAEAIHQTMWFWIVGGLALVLGGVPFVFKKTLEIATRVRNYPKLLRRVAEAESVHDSLVSQLETAKADAAERWRAGVKEGRAEVVGELLSQRVDVPLLVSIAEADGDLMLVGKYQAGQRPLNGARFRLVANETGDIKGVVEVVQSDDSRRVVYLRCIDPRAPRFWSAMMERVAYDFSPPSHVSLATYGIDWTAEVETSVTSAQGVVEAGDD